MARKRGRKEIPPKLRMSRIPTSIKFNHYDEEYFRKLNRILSEQTGRKLNRTYIVKSLMAMGMPYFQEKWGITKEVLDNADPMPF